MTSKNTWNTEAAAKLAASQGVETKPKRAKTFRIYRQPGPAARALAVRLLVGEADRSG